MTYKNLKKVQENDFVTYMVGEECYLVGYIGEGNSAIVPNGVTVICQYTFQTAQLKKVTIPASVKQIEFSAFKGAVGLEEAVFVQQQDWHCSDTRIYGRSFANYAMIAQFLTIDYVDYTWNREE